ncbi:unnamed protein product [Gongylonema pulchrum]|uniref:Uncharacterized protein n=1 Tax=Gongylonema pulchrum TaxID=637853 RepID=A0A183F0H6_9BILA|nr:unnamed protein product [Gongylonema pulchrum]
MLSFRESDSPTSLIKSSTPDPLTEDYDERSWFGESGVPDSARDPISQALALLGKPQTMGNLEALIRYHSFSVHL